MCTTDKGRQQCFLTLLAPVVQRQPTEQMKKISPNTPWFEWDEEKSIGEEKKLKSIGEEVIQNRFEEVIEEAEAIGEGVLEG